MWNKQSSYDDSYLFPMNKKEKLQALKRNAYYDVLHAFSAESSQLSETRVMIITDLIREWDISYRTYYTVENRLEYEPLIQYLREQESQILFKCISRNPESLVNRWIKIRLPDEDEFITFNVKDYNKREGTHKLVSAYSTKEYEDPCDWIDIKLFPEQDIEWAEAPLHSQEQFVRRHFLEAKPGKNLYEEALLRAARQADEEKLLKKIRSKFQMMNTNASGSLWISGSAESLIGKHLCVLISEDVERILVVKGFDANYNKHVVQNIDPNARETAPYLLDLRNPPEDIFWKAEDTPIVVATPNQSAAQDTQTQQSFQWFEEIKH